MEEHRMTEEIRKKLLARMPFSLSATIEFTPPTYLTKKEGTEEFDIPVEYHPLFCVRPLRKDELERVRVVTTSKSPDEKEIRAITRKCIVGWSNMWDAGTMQPLDYKADPTSGLDKDLFEMLPIQIVTETFLFVSSISGLLSHDKLGLTY